MATIDIPLQGDGRNGASREALSTVARGDGSGDRRDAARRRRRRHGTIAGGADFNAMIEARAPLVIGFQLAPAFVLLLIAFRSVFVPATAIILTCARWARGPRGLPPVRGTSHSSLSTTRERRVLTLSAGGARDLFLSQAQQWVGRRGSSLPIQSHRPLETRSRASHGGAAPPRARNRLNFSRGGCNTPLRAAPRHGRKPSRSDWANSRFAPPAAPGATPSPVPKRTDAGAHDGLARSRPRR